MKECLSIRFKDEEKFILLSFYKSALIQLHF